MAESIYLDHNATAPLSAVAAEAMAAAQRRRFANPASQHAPGRAARRELEAARDRVASLLGARPTDRLIFTSGGTESNALALRGLAGPPPRRVVVSAIEHPSVAATADQMRREGYDVVSLGVGANGVIRPEQLDTALDAAGDPPVVSVMLGNNETGVVQPIAEIAKRCAARGAPVHTDAVQAVGKTAVDFAALGVAALSFTAHKFHGPLGVGGLLVRGDVALAPLLHGGFQQAGERPGTEPVDLVAGLRAALDWWDSEREERPRRLADLRDSLERAVLNETPGAVVVAADSPRLPHTSCLAFPGVDRQALAMALDQAGVACSTGSACASGSSEPSPVLVAMGVPNPVVQGAIRLSLGAETTADEIASAARLISQAVSRLRRAESG